MDASIHLQGILKTLPDKPGVYQYYDSEGKILYVGKAKSLKKRVYSYFNKDHHDSNKTRILVSKIVDIKTIIVDTELDALLLENNLIKKYQPRYNVLLKDDKTYPWICIKKERFPRIFATRLLIKDGSDYYGPYPNKKVMYTLLDFINSLYQKRTCSLALDEESIMKGKFKICLEYHIKNCLAPCVGFQTEQDYNKVIQEIRLILKGNIGDLMRGIRAQMLEYASKFEFEKAHDLKLRYEILEKFKSKSTIVNPNIHNVDVFSIHTDEKIACINYLRVLEGSIVQSFTLELKKRLDEQPEELLTIAIGEMRQRFSSNASEIIVPIMPDLEDNFLTITIPQRGDKKSLLDLSVRNVLNYVREKSKQLELVDPERHTKRILEKLQKDLRMPILPKHIECFDNSNFHGSFPVSAMVCFKDARPSKKDYRHFNVKTVVGPDDFATMAEVIERRYSRLLKEGETLPQLIIVDGGKGQLGAALGALDKIGLRGKISIVGIAKRLEEIYFPGDPLPLYIDKKSESLKLIQQLRNEAHRFGITHHRKRRDDGTLKTELSEIEGIGKSTSEKLLADFRSVKKISELSVKELALSIGNSKAEKVFLYFHASKDENSETLNT
jgi:excinuclease ABC subunit C